MEITSVERVEVAIVGAGTAGLAALREVRNRTDDFVLINAGPYGTTCARVGCMPSKALIAAADAFHARRKFGAFGIRGGEDLRADVPSVLRRVRRVRDGFVAGVMRAIEELGPRNIAGHARLDGPNRLVVGDRVIEAKQIVLAPGSSPVVPEPWQDLGDRILTSDTLFEQEDLPRKIGVIGLGPLGVEIAQALARLGIEIHGFDLANRMAGISAESVAEVVRDRLAREFPIHLETEVELSAVEPGVEIRWDGGSVTVDRVLAAVGRRPNIEGLGLETLGVPLDDSGIPEVDAGTMRIGTTPVLLVGDATDERPVMHEAADEGHIAGLNATGDEPIRLSRRTPLTIVFCDPQVALVGKRAADLDPDTVLFGESSFTDQGRARILQENHGLLRLYAARSDGRILGAEMAIPTAEHIAHLLALAISQELTVHDLLRMPFYHPTLEEGLRPALRSISRELPPRALSDLARCESLGAEALD